MPDETPEVPLTGGTANRGLVVRSGQTVRRPQRPNSDAIRALLGHLEQAGFDGAPRFLGTDVRGREVLSYISGEAVTPPYPAWSLTDAALRSVAELLRRYHEAVAGFDATAHRWPRLPPEPYSGTLVCHNDPNLDNVVFRAGKAVALIDFDLASPGTALWDVAAAVRLWSPLRTTNTSPTPAEARPWPSSVLSCEPTEKPTSTPSASSPPLPRTTTGCTPSLKKGPPRATQDS